MDPKVVAHAERRFDWPLCYEAEDLVLARIESFLDRNRSAALLARRMLEETGTLILDWVDHLVVPVAEAPVWRDAGYVDDPPGEAPTGQQVLWHPEAMLPRVLLDSSADSTESPSVLAIRPESLAEFIAVRQLDGAVVGEPLSRFRRITISEEGGTRFEAIERRGYRGYVPLAPQAGEAERLSQAAELWRTRERDFADDAGGYQRAQELLDRIIRLVGRDLACHIVFAGERTYWESRNRAARIQKARQDALGLGWGNHDHHTFRSSRRHFVDLMEALEKLGFERRERYYAGAQAGWGAQILEQPVEGIVAFCDVDLQPEETEIDFSRRPLPPASRLGTIGLWVGLHGESFLQAGMHHLECRFDYERLRDQLAGLNVGTMKPFSDFEFLKQAFTEGERWPVRRERAEKLFHSGLITKAQLDQFVAEGAIGSHLENLQRKGGFKGFNQKSVSVIIQATDPRRQESAVGASSA